MDGQELHDHAQRMRSLDQLTGGLAHDFNNLLTVIQGNLEVLQDTPAIVHDTQCAPLVSSALRAARRGAELTRSLLAYSRRQQLMPSAVDPIGMLAALLAMLRRTIDQRIRLDLVRAPGCPPCIADPALLESALLNIALNARDAMPHGGTLTCSVAACDALPESLAADAEGGTASPTGYVAISLRDTGTGMPEAVRRRVFEPFFTTKGERGTGLGLSSAYGFVKQSNGAMQVESVQGAGTCVTLFLPCAALASARTEPAPDPVASPLKDLDVMLIDDDIDVLAVALAFLQGLGCRVRAYTSAEHAIDALEKEPLPSILLSDLELGSGMRGGDFARLALTRWPSLAFLIASGLPPQLDPNDTVLRKVGWLAKPFSRQQLAGAIVSTLAAASAA